MAQNKTPEAPVDATLPEKAGVERKVPSRAKRVKTALVAAKDAVVSKVANSSDTLQDVKEWGTDKAKMVDQGLDMAKDFVEKAGEAIEDMRQWSNDKARKVDETLGMAQDVVAQTGETIDSVKQWGAEQATAAGQAIEKTQASLEERAGKPASSKGRLKRVVESKPLKDVEPDKK